MDKKQHLLDTALRLFVEYGFHGTPTGRIAKEAGLSSGTLFYFFPTKDDLVTSLYVNIKGRMIASILASIEEKTTVRQLIKGYYQTSLFWALENPVEFDFTSQFSNSPYLLRVAAKEIESHTTPFLDIIRRGIKEGSLKNLHPELIFALIRGQAFSIHQYIRESQGELQGDSKIIDTSFLLLWDMIAATGKSAQDCALE